MKPERVSRRAFLQRTAAGTSIAALAGASVARGFAANEKVQVGWIGVGGRGTQLLTDFVANCKDARTAAICDLIPDRVDAAKKVAEADKPTGYTDFREMMDKEKLDGILVATEPFNHAPLVVPVLDAGFHCFAEKPMDTSVEDVDTIVKAARKAKGFYQIGTQRRYNPGYLSAMKPIHAGEFGPVMFMQGHWHWPWRNGDRKVARDGGFFVEQASHHTDVMTWVMGDKPPESCVSSGYSPTHADDPNVFNETHSATSFQWPDKTIFSYTHLSFLPGKYTSERLGVFCDKGCVELGEGMFYGVDEKEKRIGEASGRDWGKGTTEELQDFVANVKSGGKRLPNANVETGRISTLMCLMARMAMINAAKNAYEPRAIHWKDLGSTTDLV